MSSPSNTTTPPPPPNQILLKDIHIDSETMAVSVMAGMLEIAQRRGTFNIEESAKIWECIQKLQKPQSLYAGNGASTPTPQVSPPVQEKQNVELSVTETN
tara:strand:- start:7 stop:306 length:300 start_codon:yes stop_codon:yes gene_type:complete